MAGVAGVAGVAAAAALAAGAALRIWQYGAGASQWLDELALSRCIVGLGWRSLLWGRLDFAQVAPRGFLAAERAAVVLWGSGDLVLRLAPLAAALIALALFHRLAVRTLATPPAVAVACALFALQPELIRYAAEVKPYAGDLALALGTTLLAASLPAASPRRGLWIGAAGVLAACCSNAAVLVLAGLAAALLASRVAAAATARHAARGGRRTPVPGPQHDTADEPPAGRVQPTPGGAADPPWDSASRLRRAAAAKPAASYASTAKSADRDAAIALTIAIAFWAAGGAAATLLVSREVTPANRIALQHFWAPAMAPIPHTWSGDAAWAADTLAGEIGANGLGYPLPWACIAVAALGAGALWRRDRTWALLVFCPVAVAVAAAEARIYPFNGRLVLWIVPALLLAIAAGAEALARGSAALCRRAGGRLAMAAGAASCLVHLAALTPAVAALAADPPVYRIEDSRPLLHAVSVRRQPGDAIYVYYGAGHALSFYGPRYGFAPQDYVLGGNHRGDTRAYLRELDRWRGRPRLWVLIAHAQPRLEEESAILRYLDRLGRRRLELRAPPHVRSGGLPVKAFLYDLSAPRLDPDAAATFPIVPPSLRFDPLLERRGAVSSIPEIP